MNKNPHQNEQKENSETLKPNTSNHEHYVENQFDIPAKKLRKLTIYRQVAKAALMSWNGLSEEEAEKKVRTETFDELENQVWASGSLSYAVDAIAQMLQLHDIEKEYLRKVIIDKDNVTITPDYQKCLDGINERSSMLHGDAGVLYALSAIHDGWVKDNAKKFNQEGREAKRYQHLPFALIGWKEAKADLLFLSPIIEAIENPTSESSLEEAYNNHVPTYLERKGIETKAQLVSKIMKGGEFYAPLTEKNTATSKEVATAMADKVLEVNPQVNVVFKANTAQI